MNKTITTSNREIEKGIAYGAVSDERSTTGLSKEDKN